MLTPNKIELIPYPKHSVGGVTLTPNKIELIPYPKQIEVYAINHYGGEKLIKSVMWLSYFEKISNRKHPLHKNDCKPWYLSKMKLDKTILKNIYRR